MSSGRTAARWAVPRPRRLLSVVSAARRRPATESDCPPACRQPARARHRRPGCPGAHRQCRHRPGKRAHHVRSRPAVTSSRGEWFSPATSLCSDDSMTLRAPRAIYYRDERRAEGFEDVRLDDGHVRLRAAYGELPHRPASGLFPHAMSSSSTARRSWPATPSPTTATPGARSSRAMSASTTRADGVTIYGGHLDHDAGEAVQPDDRRSAARADRHVGGGQADTLQVRARVLEAYRDTTKRLIAPGQRRDRALRSRRHGPVRLFLHVGDSIQLRAETRDLVRQSQVNGDSINICAAGNEGSAG